MMLLPLEDTRPVTSGSFLTPSCVFLFLLLLFFLQDIRTFTSAWTSVRANSEAGHHFGSLLRSNRSGMLFFLPVCCVYPWAQACDSDTDDAAAAARPTSSACDADKAGTLF